MLNMQLDKAKGLFFDRPAVMAAVDRAQLQALSKAGAFVMRAARGLIRSPGKRTKNAKPGKPPNNQTGLLKKNIFFAWDPSTRSVVIGPAKLNKPGDVPALLEFGGTASRPRKTKPPRRLVYAGNPYMQPGLQKALPKLPEPFRNSVRG